MLASLKCFQDLLQRHRNISATVQFTDSARLCISGKLINNILIITDDLDDLNFNHEDTDTI